MHDPALKLIGRRVLLLERLSSSFLSSPKGGVARRFGKEDLPNRGLIASNTSKAPANYLLDSALAHTKQPFYKQYYCELGVVNGLLTTKEHHPLTWLNPS